MASGSKIKVSPPPSSLLRINPNRYQPYQPVFPFIRPQIPSSVTSGSIVSQDTPTPKNKKPRNAKSTPQAAPTKTAPRSRNGSVQSAVRSEDNMGPHHEAEKASKKPVKEEQKDADTGDESTSMGEDMDLEDFDTEGMTKEELELWSQCAPEDQELVRPVKIEQPPVHPSTRTRRPSEQIPVKDSHMTHMEKYIRNHPFYTQQAVSKHTTSQRRRFEKDVYDHARGLGYSKENARKQVVTARHLCGEEYNSDDSKLGSEIDDSETISRRDTGAVAKSEKRSVGGGMEKKRKMELTESDGGVDARPSKRKQKKKSTEVKSTKSDHEAPLVQTKAPSANYDSGDKLQTRIAIATITAMIDIIEYHSSNGTCECINGFNYFEYQKDQAFSGDHEPDQRITQEEWNEAHEELKQSLSYHQYYLSGSRIQDLIQTIHKAEYRLINAWQMALGHNRASDFECFLYSAIRDSADFDALLRAADLEYDEDRTPPRVTSKGGNEHTHRAGLRPEASQTADKRLIKKPKKKKRKEAKKLKKTDVLGADPDSGVLIDPSISPWKSIAVDKAEQASLGEDQLTSSKPAEGASPRSKAVTPKKVYTEAEKAEYNLRKQIRKEDNRKKYEDRAANAGDPEDGTTSQNVEGTSTQVKTKKSEKPIVSDNVNLSSDLVHIPSGLLNSTGVDKAEKASSDEEELTSTLPLADLIKPKRVLSRAERAARTERKKERRKSKRRESQRFSINARDLVDGPNINDRDPADGVTPHHVEEASVQASDDAKIPIFKKEPLQSNSNKIEPAAEQEHPQEGEPSNSTLPGDVHQQNPEIIEISSDPSEHPAEKPKKWKKDSKHRALQADSWLMYTGESAGNFPDQLAATFSLLEREKGFKFSFDEQLQIQESLQELYGAADSGKDLQDRILDRIAMTQDRSEMIPPEPKKRKKKDKERGKSVSRKSSFQSPMIRDAEAAIENKNEELYAETMPINERRSLSQPNPTDGLPNPPITPLIKLSNLDIDILFPFSDSSLSSAPPSPILSPSPCPLTPRPRHSASILSTPPSTPGRPHSPSSSKKPRKTLPPKISPYFPTPPKTPRQPRPKRPATSCIPFPPLSSPRFGLIQESLAHDPFALLIAVIFLNQTRGSVAIPVFYRLILQYPTPGLLAAANYEDIVTIFSTLGLQNQRARKVIALAKAWVGDPPFKGRRYRRLNYPRKGDGADIKADESPVEDESVDGRVAWEIGNLPGVGAYAIDSWRIFCRDGLRGMPHGLASLSDLDERGADDRKEKREKMENNSVREEELSKEWTRVLPRDKELRAYLRWRWLRLGWVWDPRTGERTLASEEVIREAEKGGVVVEGAGGVQVKGVIPATA